MTDKELRKLSRTELVEIIYELQKQNESGAEEIKQLRMQSAGRTEMGAVQRKSGVSAVCTCGTARNAEKGLIFG